MLRCYRKNIISLFSYPCFSDDLTTLQFFFTDPSENMREILQNVAKQQGVSNMRKLGHLNNFIKVCHLKSGSGVAVDQGMQESMLIAA